MKHSRIYLVLLICIPILNLLSQGVSQAQISVDLNHERPTYQVQEYLYADIDTTNRILYLLTGKELWKYDLKKNVWSHLRNLTFSRKELKELEFGYDAHHNQLLLWSRGVGKVYSIDLNTYELNRIDQSFDHKNQFGHLPFFRHDKLYAFGGYGYWDWHNLITYYNPNIREWKLSNMDRSSRVPKERIPFVGFYDPVSDALFIHGGRTAKNFLRDDSNLEYMDLDDYWKFDFKSESWVHLGKVENPDFNYLTKETSNPKLGRKNKLSTSVYSMRSGIWYIPVAKPEFKSNKLFLRPVQTDPFQELPTLEVQDFNNAEFFPSNYLFDHKNQSLILVSLARLTNTDTLSISIKEIPEDSLLASIKDTKSTTYALESGIAGLALITMILLFIYLKKNTDLGSGFLFNSAKDLSEFEWLTKDEKSMLIHLYNIKNDIDATELEECIWPDTKNFDYRRKLRNETINSINQKFKSRLKLDRNLIIRKKDPTDNRRYRYRLNPEFRQ